MIINKKTLLKWILLLAIIFVIREWQQQNLLDSDVPIFNSKTLTNEIISSTDTKPILIHFWATWCKICSLENDNIQMIAKNYKVLNIAMSSGSDTELINYAQQNKMAINNIINDNNSSLTKKFGVIGTPTSFIVFNNKIKFIEVGYTTTIGLWLRLWLSQWL